MKNKNKPITLIIILILLIIYIIFIKTISNNNNKSSTKNINYENYCDSIFDNNPDYYFDVLIETDSFKNYIDKNGKWWKK